MRKFLVVVWLTATLMVSLSACNKEKETVNDMILGTWSLTSNPSCTWTFLSGGGFFNEKYEGKAFVFVDTFSKPITSYYHIENNSLKLFSYPGSHRIGISYTSDSDISGPNIEDSFLCVDNISKDILQLSGNIRIYEMIRNSNGTYSRADYGSIIVPVSYEFRKSN